MCGKGGFILNCFYAKKIKEKRSKQEAGANCAEEEREKQPETERRSNSA